MAEAYVDLDWDELKERVERRYRVTFGASTGFFQDKDFNDYIHEFLSRMARKGWLSTVDYDINPISAGLATLPGASMGAQARGMRVLGVWYDDANGAWPNEGYHRLQHQPLSEVDPSVAAETDQEPYYWHWDTPFEIIRILPQGDSTTGGLHVAMVGTLKVPGATGDLTSEVPDQVWNLFTPFACWRMAEAEEDTEKIGYYRSEFKSEETDVQANVLNAHTPNRIRDNQFKHDRKRKMWPSR